MFWKPQLNQHIKHMTDWCLTGVWQRWIWKAYNISFMHWVIIWTGHTLQQQFLSQSILTDIHILTKRWTYFDFTIISVSFTGDKAPHCWDTCVIMRVSGASCLLPPVVLSTPLPLCLIQSVYWGGVSATANAKSTVASWKVWRMKHDPVKLILALNSFRSMPHLPHVAGHII